MNRIVIALLKPFSFVPAVLMMMMNFLLLITERNGIFTAQ